MNRRFMCTDMMLLLDVSFIHSRSCKITVAIEKHSLLLFEEFFDVCDFTELPALFRAAPRLGVMELMERIMEVMESALNGGLLIVLTTINNNSGLHRTLPLRGIIIPPSSDHIQLCQVSFNFFPLYGKGGGRRTDTITGKSLICLKTSSSSSSFSFTVLKASSSSSPAEKESCCHCCSYWIHSVRRLHTNPNVSC